jgi:3-(3-hydroxy-phenyl)propionate hydroxylase
MPDLDLIVEGAPVRAYGLLHKARPVLLDLGMAGGTTAAAWADRVQLVRAAYAGPWELPVIGMVPAPKAVLIRPDGHVAWVGMEDDVGLTDALTTWFGPAS